MKEETSNDSMIKDQKGVEQKSGKKSSVMIVIGIIGMFSWIIMFSLGILVNSKPYRESTLNHLELKIFLLSILTFSPTAFADNSVSPQQYALSAGVVSLFSFVVGYDPTVFRSLLSIAGKFKQKP
jgi:hypothetical protein